LRFKKLLLIYPFYPGSHYRGGRNFFPPIGLGILGEMLRQCGADYTVVDLGLGYDMPYLLERIEDFSPDAVAISMMTYKYTHLYSVLDQIKDANPDVKIIAGGPHLTAWKARVLEQCPSIDFGVSREGEFTLQELCRGEQLPSIKGLVYRKDGQIVFNGERELIADLDSIPFPQYEQFEMDKYKPTIQINSSRGCPYQCIFCQSCSVLGRKWRARSAENIADEIQFWFQKDYRNFTFVDDNFTLNKKRIYQICKEIESRQLFGLHLSAPGVRVDSVDRNLLLRMKEVGFRYLAFGIEAGNNKILKILKKGFTIEQAEAGVRQAVELGFDVKLYFLVGSPHETLDDIRDSMDFAMKYPIQDVNFASLMPIPETELMTWVEKEGRLLAPYEVYLNDYAEFERIPHFDAPGMSLPERKRALRLSERLSLNLKRPGTRKALRNRLKHLGILGNFIADVYTIPFVYQAMQHSRFGSTVKRVGTFVLSKLGILKT